MTDLTTLTDAILRMGDAVDDGTATYLTAVEASALLDILGAVATGSAAAWQAAVDESAEPTFARQTGCRHCNLDIEWFPASAGQPAMWIDRGGNWYCPSFPGTCRTHEPVAS